MKYSGVYWIGPMFDSGGYGNVSRNYVKALDKAGIPVRIFHYGEVHKDIGEDTLKFLISKQNTDVGNNAVLIVNNGGDNVNMSVPEIMHNVKKRIGVTIFETDRLPSQWVSSCNAVDELWVCGEFNYNTFKNSGIDQSKMKIVPYALDTILYDSSKPYTPYFNNENEFKFLYVSTFGYRKGYDLIIKSYCEEFTKDDNVCLVLKVDVPFFTTEDNVIKILSAYIPDSKNNPKIKLLVGKESQDRLVDLYRSVDAYISTDRANGWGMPCMECMALGTPTATINWSGSTEFMKDDNSFLIEPEKELIPVDYNLQNDPIFGSIYKGHLWADVKVDTVRKVLRNMYEDKDRREAVAKKAKEDIETRYSLEAVGKKIEEILSLTL